MFLTSALCPRTVPDSIHPISIYAAEHVGQRDEQQRGAVGVEQVRHGAHDVVGLEPMFEGSARSPLGRPVVPEV